MCANKETVRHAKNFSTANRCADDLDALKLLQLPNFEFKNSFIV